MSRKKRRVQYHLSPAKTEALPDEDLRAILRGADDLIMRGGRTLLVKVLRGSRAKEVTERGLDKSPVYGFYRDLPEDDVLARIDWAITHRYLAIQYDGKLPLLVYTPLGWEIEKDTYSNELLKGFDERLASSSGPWDMSYLKDRNRELIWLLLDKVAETKDPKYIPLLQEWARVEYKKVRQRTIEVVGQLMREQAAGQ